MFQVLSHQKSHMQESLWPTLLKNTFQDAKGFFIEKTHSDQGLTILFCEPSTGPIGGATLTKRKIDSLSPKLSHLLERLVDDVYIWECSTVFFTIPDDSSIHNNFDHFSALCHQFYRGLYDCLYKFATANTVKHIMSLNVMDEHQDISFFGQWPFSYEIESKGLYAGDDTEYVMGLVELNVFNYQRFQQSF